MQTLSAPAHTQQHLPQLSLRLCTPPPLQGGVPREVGALTRLRRLTLTVETVYGEQLELLTGGRAGLLLLSWLAGWQARARAKKHALLPGGA